MNTLLGWRPLRTPGVATRATARGVLIEGYLDAYETNPTGGDIWARCTGESTVEQIAGEVASCHGLPADEALTAVVAFVSDLRDLGFVS